jgi:hypothetical protein
MRGVPLDEICGTQVEVASLSNPRRLPGAGSADKFAIARPFLRYSARPFAVVCMRRTWR